MSSDHDRPLPQPDPSITTTATATTPDDSPPFQRPRWLYSRGKGWAIFSDGDDEKLESRWQSLGGAEWASSLARKARATSVGVDQRVGEDGGGRGNSTSIPIPPTGVAKIKDALRDWLPGEKEEGAFAPAGSVSDTRSPLNEDEGGKSRRDGKGDEETHSKLEQTQDGKGKVVVNEILDPEEGDEERRTKVEVMEDHLFDVDLERMVLYPVFWKGVLLKVVRATWFYSSSTDGSYAPISWDDDLSKDLDKAYLDSKPYLRANAEARQGGDGSDGQVISASPSDGASDRENKLYPLPSMKNAGKVRFDDETKGRIYSEDLAGRLMSVLGGSLVVRGFDEAERIAKEKSHRGFGGFTMPWDSDDGSEGEGDDDDDSLDRKKAGGKTKKQQRQESGSTFGAWRARRKEGAAKTSGRPPAGGGADGSSLATSLSAARGDSVDDGERSFASKLWPSSDASWKPKVNLLRMLGLGDEKAEEESKRERKQMTTEESMDRERQNDATAAEGAKVYDENGKEITMDRVEDPPELVLCVHGIGQKLQEDFDAVDFVYDVERLRNLSSKMASDPMVRKLSRGRRAQFLPICWRRSLSFDEAHEENDNFFTLEDITNQAAIPVVRNLISKVILDVPFYLSHHKQKMIDSVIAELNRTYRLFVRRNPDFERKGGRVSIIGHSLGSALSADVLSSQPTCVPPLETLTREERMSNAHLHFNVKNLFFIGSPVAFFFYLDGGQLVARRGNERTKDFDDDSTLDQAGKYGCLAAETVYNIYSPTDPVAFQLGATVDAAYAGLLNPIPISAAVNAVLEALRMPRLSVSKVFSKYGDRPFQGVGKALVDFKKQQGRGRQVSLASEAKESHSGQAKAQGEAEADERDKEIARETSEEDGRREEEDVMVENGEIHKMVGPKILLDEEGGKVAKDRLLLEKLEQAERRFRALNPHGCIDFQLSSDGLSEYLDMLSAHVSYWTNDHFSTFVLTQLFSDWTSVETPTVVPHLERRGEDGGEDGRDKGGQGDDQVDDDEEEEEEVEEEEERVYTGWVPSWWPWQS
ncbi:hypothetical protein IE53DRAFT_400894 [Violaceomyces palustris]|uniref:Uncharacterized protein n=1 Tax=Violaceomyces palustris TaxID=1673888 RepID=A0ACD0NQB3_9BASI|nr:hypothetical protein IE53DRAFT_400894 [Violaceomyces palustris]